MVSWWLPFEEKPTHFATTAPLLDGFHGEPKGNHSFCGSRPLISGTSCNPEDKPDTFGRTPLVVAAIKGQVEVVRILLEFGADKSNADTRQAISGIRFLRYVAYALA